MSFPASISATAIEFVVRCLLPLLLSALGDDEPGARALVLELLACHNPRTAHELRLAGNAVGLSLQGLAKLADSAAPGTTPERQDVALKWACSLTRVGQAAERRLDELQRRRRVRARTEQLADQTAAEPTTATPPVSNPAPAAPLPVAIPPAVESSATSPDRVEASAQPDVPEAEAKLKSAEKLLALMKAHWKGAPPPHSKAAQDIKAQERVVAMARMALSHARRRDQLAAQAQVPEPASAAG